MMYRTKQDVDRHVSSVLARIKDEKERNARGYQIAKLYYEAKEYEIARRYLAGFLSIRENLPQAHKLMGQIHEACGQTAQAVASYKRSLELDDKQKDVVYKICEQYSKTNMDPDRAKFWAEKGEKLFPNSDVVFKLKEKAMTGQGNKNFKEMESLISAELYMYAVMCLKDGWNGCLHIAKQKQWVISCGHVCFQVKRPGDVDLRIRLLKMYVTTGHVNDAYHHAVEIEQTLAYVDSLPWYEYLVDLLGTFQQEAGCSEDSVFYSFKLMAVQNLVHLTLQYADVVNAAEALHIFDLCIHQAQQIHKMTKEWQALLKEMQGQFFYMAGTLLLKRAQRNHLTWRDATGVAAACYLASHQFPPLNSRAEWFVRSPINKLKTNDRLLKISNFRCSQTGHLLNMMCRGEKEQWARDLKRHCTLQGREKLYDSLFTLREMKTLKPKSYLMQSKAFCDFEISVPSTEQLVDYDSVAHLLQPDNLHCLVWLALQHYSWRDNTQPRYDFDVFSTLQYTTTTNLENAAPESLCQLDVEVFLYATVRCSALKVQESRLILPQDGSQPEFLPTVLCKPLCSKEQADWWEAAYKLYANIAKDNFPKLRLVLQRGLEAVRIIGNHGMSINMIVHLAKTLDERASEMRAKPDQDSASDPVISAVETRTAHYWRKALELLHKMERHQPVRISQERLFPEDGAKELDSKTIRSLIGDGELYIGVIAMNNKEYESALMSFEKVERPYASYYTAQVYKQLANSAVCDKTKDQLTPDVRAKYEALLIKARDAFYLTLDRLRGDKNHELNKLLSRDLDDIEIRLSRADTEEGIQNDSVNLSVNSEDFESPMGLTGVQTMPIATPSRLPYLAQSTPNLKPIVRNTLSTLIDEDKPHLSMSEVSGRIRPSPERLEAQMRALTLSQDTLLKTVMEQNKELIQNNKEIMDELKESRTLNKQLQDQLTQMTQARLMGSGPFLPPQGLSQTLPTGSPYMMGAPLQAGGFPYSPSPSWMPQYGYQMPSPSHAGSVRFPSVNRLGPRHHPINQGDFYSGPAYSFATADLEEDIIDRDDNEEEDPYHIDGECFVDDGTGAQPYYLQDVQDWPYGNRAGLEGKSTITYQPHMRPPVPQQGLVGAGLRGQSLQYGYRPPVPSPAMPGPGYFSSPQTHASVYPSNTTTHSSLATALATNAPGLFSAQGTGSPNLTSTVSTQALPPNVVAGQAMALKPNVPVSMVTRPQMAGKSAPMTSVGQPLAGQLSTGQTASAQRPDQPAAHPSTPTLPEGVSLLFAGRATITANANKPLACSLKMFHIVRGSRPMIAVQAVTETKEVVMNHEFSAEVQVKPAMFVPDTFEWTKTGSTDKFVLKFSDTNETAGFNLAVEKVKVLLQNIAAAREGTPTGTTSAPALAKSGQPVLQTGGSAAGMLSQIAAKHKDTQNKPSLPTVPAADAAKGDAGKNVFGGFTFKAAPIISSPATSGTEERQKAVPSGKALTSPSKTTTKPFEGFSFAAGTQNPATQPGQGAATPSFAGLSAGNTASPVVNRSPGVKVTAGKDSPGRREEDTVDEYEPNVDFQPVIPLPDLVEVKTGEEEEDKLFSERCRLFRFDTESKQWKERGVGEMKILRHKKTKRTRIVMRRDQVLKLCANHYLSEDMKLSPMPSSSKSWCWNAVDYADEEVKNEQLAARFKNAEIAATFKKVFEECVEKIKAEPEVTSSTDAPTAKVEDKSPAVSKPLSELFKPAEGSWECSGCFIRNEGTVKKCPACGNLKPGVKPEDVKEEPSSTSAFGATGTGFKFGSSGFSLGSTGGFSFGSPVPSSKGASAKPEADSSTGFSFGSPASSSKDVSEKSTTGISSGYTFGSFSQNKDASKPAANSTSGVVFGEQETKPSSSEAAASQGKKTDVSSKTLSELFKKPEGSWECSGCLIVNSAAVKKCPACGTLQAGVKPEEVQGASGFKFTSGAGFSFGTQTKPAESSGSSTFTFSSSEKTEGSSGFVFGSSSSGNKPSGFSFGVTTTASTTATEAEKTSGTQGKTLKDLLQSDSPATGSTLLTDIAQSETSTKTPVSSKSLFGSSTTGTVAGALGGTGSASDSFVFGSPLTKFTFTGVGPSTPSTSAKAHVVTSPKSPEVDDHGHYVNKEGEDSHIFFEPVVKLPEKVDLKTGEEEETVMFESRAKLYRFDNSEWKERGLGVVKLLHHSKNKKIRILMRRDQILKICCNHQITTDMDLKPMAKSEGKAWIWHAVDFADEDHKHQQLAIRFKTPEIGNKFKETFELGRQLAAERSPVKGSQSNLQKEAPTPASAKAGEDDDVVFVREEKATPEQVVKARSYKLPDNFYLYEKVQPCPGCLGCVDGDEEKLTEMLKNSPAPPSTRRRSPRKSESEKTAAVSLFGSAPVTNTQSDSAVSTSSMFGSQSGGLSFAALAQKSATPFAFKPDGNKPFSFSGAGAQVFGGKKDDGAAGDDDEVAPSNDIHFEPIISLQEMDVKTGEEDEEVLFCQRSKLFRFDKEAKQWKERGTGEIKILKHRETGAYRILQRRDQVLKISCNHLLTPDLQLKPMSTSETSWCWTAQDYAEEEARVEQFAIKFKNVTLAKEFRDMFIKCQNDMKVKEQKAGVVEEIVEPSVRSSTGFTAGDKDNVCYSQQLDKTAGVVEEIVEPSVRSSTGFTTGDKGSVHYSQQLDKTAGVVEEIVEPSVRSSTGFTTGDKGNVYYSQQLDKAAGVVEEIVEPSVRSSTGFTTGDKDNVYYSQQLDKTAGVVEEIVEPSVRSSIGFTTGDKGNVYYSQQLDKAAGVVEEIVEPSVRSSTGFTTGDKGNVGYSQQLDKTAGVVEEIAEPSLRSSTGFTTGDKGNVYYSQQLDKTADVVEEIVEPSVRSSTGFTTGDQGNVYYSQQLDNTADVVEEIVEPSVRSSTGFTTGDKGNVYYSQQLDNTAGVVEEIVEPSVRSSTGFTTGDKGNVYYSQQLDKTAGVVEEIVEPSVRSSTGFTTGDKGSVYYSQQLDKTADVVEKIEPSVRSSTGFTTGDKGNVYYSKQLIKAACEEDNIKVSVQESGKGDNSAHSTGGAGDAGTEAEEEEEDEYEDVEDEDDEDYEDILQTIFEKRATLSAFEDNKWKVLGMGDLKVLYDDDVTAHRISMETDNQTKVCNHIISKESSLSSDEKRVCQWAAVDFSTDEPIKRMFMAQFSSAPALKEFTEHFHKGVQLALESDISERDMMSTFPREIVRPEVVGSPDSKDGAGGVKFGGV
ncbi:E3 SUMO-protein ligase RanBP2-like [Liolophura sinensis]|uniref:E3 SUMO-protein ligase RanBP2-like n=1 Tax=Liolophura sinensis TaxID=3198878 RepID=UPI0031593AB8